MGLLSKIRELCSEKNDAYVSFQEGEKFLSQRSIDVAMCGIPRAHNDSEYARAFVNLKSNIYTNSRKQEIIEITGEYRAVPRSSRDGVGLPCPGKETRIKIQIKKIIPCENYVLQSLQAVA